MDKEIDTLEHAGTWVNVLRPTNRNIVSAKWIFRIKRKANGEIDKYKARLVACRFTQIYGIDYYSTYSPVAKMASIRLILALAARQDWEIESFDFNGAYLNGELQDNEEIYMEPPPGYENIAPNCVKRLQKSLYGLKQAGRRWYDTLSRALTNIGFRVTHADPGVFILIQGEERLMLAVHVDDCILTGSSKRLVTEFKGKINKCYVLTDLGPVHWLLGIKITRDRQMHTLSMSQTSYIDSILVRYALTEAKPQKSPMIPGMQLSKDQGPKTAEEVTRMRKTPYREAIGSLMYLAVATWPDIAFMVSRLSQFLDNPGPQHWEAVKRVFRYLIGTKTAELTYGIDQHDLQAYTDTDGSTQEHCRAISGYAFLFDGGAISWSSKKQELVSQSTTEAEYVAATHAAKEAAWLRILTDDLFPPLSMLITLYCDNQSAITLASKDNY